MKNLELAKLFDKTADVLAIKGENAFRIAAYRRISRTLEELPEDVAVLLADGRLAEVPGIGESSVEKIREYLKSGRISEFEDLWSQVPAGVMQLMQIPSVGPKTAALLWNEQGITSPEQLRAALDQPNFGKLTEIPGLGAKKLDKIKQNIAYLEKSAGRVSLGIALPLAEEMVTFLKSLPGVEQAQYCGSLRRGRDTVGDIDIAVAADAKHAGAISEAITSHPATTEVLGAGSTKTSIRTLSGLQIDVRVLPAANWGAAILYFTGSKEHNIRLRELAIAKGLKLNERGLFKNTGEDQEGDGQCIASRTEEEIYAALDLAWIPPEMREDRGEIEWAKTMLKSSHTVYALDKTLSQLLSKLPESIPSGNSNADAIHKKHLPEILQLLDIGFKQFLPEVRWVDMVDIEENTIKAIEAVLIETLNPPLNRIKRTMPIEKAKATIANTGAEGYLEKCLRGEDWVKCDTKDGRDRIIKSLSQERKGVYLFRASSSGWTKQKIGYVGIAAKGTKNSSDLRYRLKDHFQDDSTADDFADKFLTLLRKEQTEAIPNQSKTNGWVSLEISDIQGDLHMHTTASDGGRSIEEMVAEAKRRGLSYVAITDHSKSSIQANGLRVERLLEHIKAIHAVAKEAAKSGMLVLAGSEVDILADGSLDYEDDVLAKLDWVVASPHAALSQEVEPATQRLVRVCANPYVHVIGHPTGRLIPNRKGIEPDMSKVIFAAARTGVALELNAHHLRLDLRDTHLKMVRDAGGVIEEGGGDGGGVPICINTDAHGFEDFDELRYGILTARRGWLRKQDILNARPVEGFKKWLKERKELAGW
ncbi:MAG: helix-hairpin-helix domain-containing protein [Phycisphaerae bacterium]